MNHLSDRALASAAKLILTGLAALLAGCRQPGPAPAPVTARWPVMSTVAELSLPVGATNLPRLQPIVAGCFDAVENRLSFFRETSDIARINRQAGTGIPVAVAAGTADVLAQALSVARESGGAFDPTVAPLMRLWGFRGGVTNLARPAHEALGGTLALVDWRQVTLVVTAAPPHAAVHLARPGMELDLGGIAKGYAVDQAYDALLREGCSVFLVNLAGNMRGRGAPAAGRRGWRIGIRDPLQVQAGAWLGTLTLEDGEALATSGNYERFVVVEGERVPHIIDPRDGQPARGLISVTVLAGSALEADALSTALFVLGVDQRRTVLRAHPGCGAVYLTDTRPPRLRVTPELHGRFRPAPGWKTAVEWVD
ncbi:MAG: FAD:protein FMN transferase [Lentisphaerae bacterium]|nr:FAD:protein FMN transferase [Lentisphaerota bacterium]